MKLMRVFTILLSIALTSCQTSPVLKLTPTGPEDAVFRVSRDHRVVFENEFLRAVEHHLPAGTRVLLDEQRMPHILLALDEAILRIHGSSSRIISLKSAEAVWHGSDLEAIENTGADEAVVLMIGLKQTRPLSRSVPRSDDALVVAPETYRLVFENDLVRAIDVQLAPGQSTPIHSHPGWALRYRLSSMRARITLADGKVIDSESRPGTAVWTQEPSRHAYQNVGTTAGRMFLVELK